MIALSTAALSSLPADVAVPTYDRSAVTAGIVHIGVGGFHRAHQAAYLDRILSNGKGSDWGICGVGVMPGDARMRDALRAQEHLYTLVVKHPDGSVEARVIGSIVEFMLAPDDPEAVLERMAAPTTRIVSLTVTEGGYHVNTVTGELDSSAPALAADLLPGAVPSSAFGLITEALVRRRARGIEPFTIQSCDNILGNGEVARRMLTAFARLRDPELAEWVSQTVAFPSSMVDRITPVTTEADRALVAEHFGIDDQWPVVCEPYTQWVLQDDFPLGRPEWESVGVQLVQDVEPYELMKLRLLNGSHQAVAYVGHLMGFHYVHDACQDPLVAGFLMDYMNREATPTLAPVPGVDLDAYKRTLIERFANAGIADTIPRLAEFSSDRIPNWMVPMVVEQLERGGEVARLAHVVASWARYAEGIDEQGNPIHVVDRLKDRVMAAASRNTHDPKAFLRDPDLFGDLVADERFTAEYVAALASFHAVGARATLQQLAER